MSGFTLGGGFLCFEPRALACGQPFRADMRKHPDCGVPHEIHVIGISAAAAGDAVVARAYIDGF